MRNTIGLGVLEYLIWFSIPFIFILIGFGFSYYIFYITAILCWFIIGPVCAYKGALTRPILIHIWKMHIREEEGERWRLAELQRIKEQEKEDIKRKVPTEKFHDFIGNHMGIGDSSDREKFCKLLSNEYGTEINPDRLLEILSEIKPEVDLKSYGVKKIKEKEAWNLLVNYIKKCGITIRASDPELNKLQELLKVKYGIVLSKEIFMHILLDVREDVKLTEESAVYKKFKRKILSKKPRNKEGYVDAFLQIYGENWEKKIGLLEKLLEEEGILVEDIQALIHDRKRIAELERLEKELKE